MSDTKHFTLENEISAQFKHLRELGLNISAGDQVNRVAVREFYQFGTKVVAIVSDQRFGNRQNIDFSVFIEERTGLHIWQHSRIDSSSNRAAIDLETQIEWHQKYGAVEAQRMIEENEVAYLNALYNNFVSRMEA